MLVDNGRLTGKGVWGVEWSHDMSDDVTRPRKVKGVTQLSFGPNISKRAGDRGLVTMGD